MDEHPIRWFPASRPLEYEKIVSEIPFEELPKYVNHHQLYCRSVCKARLEGKPYLSFKNFMLLESEL